MMIGQWDQFLFRVALRGLLALLVAHAVAQMQWLPPWLLAGLLLGAWLWMTQRLRQSPALHSNPPGEQRPSDVRWGALLLLAGGLLAWESASDIAVSLPGGAGWLTLFWSWTLLTASGLLLLAGARYARPHTSGGG